MAEKILQTRIINKNTSYDVATTNDSFIPKLGEIVLAKLDVQKNDGQTVPTFLMKVGDGQKTLKNLNWMHCPASDVYAWAKAATKPSYIATEITRGESNVAADLSKAEQAIQALQTAIGANGSVAKQIQDAINELDVNDEAVAKQFVTAVAEADGKISVSRRSLTDADIADLNVAMAKVTGLADALALKADKTTTDAITQRLDGAITDDIKAAKKAGDDAQSYAEGVAGNLSDYETANNARVKAIEDDYTTAAEAGTIAQGKVDAFKTVTFDPLATRVGTAESAIQANATAISTLETGKVKANADAIAKLAEDIGNVTNVMNFRGVSTVEDHSDISDPKAGDVIIYGEAEYVYTENNAWVKFGDASDNATAITNLQTRVGNIETKNETQDTAIQAAQTDATKGINDAAAAKAKADANETAIGVINGSGEGSIAKAVADAKSDLEDYADQAEADAVATAKGYTDAEVQKASDAASAAQTSIAGHIADKNNPHGVTAEQVGLGNVDNKSVADIKTEFTGAVADGNTGFVTGDAAYDAIEAAKTAAATDATTKVNTLGESVAANATAIDSIENNFAKVKAVGDNKYNLVVGEAEDVIIFDCGGIE